jgi:molecular chaperone GrpE
MVNPMTDETPSAQEEPEEETQPPKAEVSDLERTRSQNEELLTKLKYVQAEYENYRKQATREMEAVLKFAHEALLARLLPVLDDFDAALANLDGEAAKGVRMVHERLLKALGEGGLQEIPAKGQNFDPYVHDCVQQVLDSGLADGLVKEVVRKGYRVQERVLRPAQVIVVKNGGESDG